MELHMTESDMHLQDIKFSPSFTGQNSYRSMSSIRLSLLTETDENPGRGTSIPSVSPGLRILEEQPKQDCQYVLRTMSVPMTAHF